MNRRYVVGTETGSVYIIREIDGRFWLSGKNVSTTRSQPLGDMKEWEIFKPSPWPPVKGDGIYMVSIHVDDSKNHPKRIPGGGKFTSNVVDFCYFDETKGNGNE